LPAAPVSEKAVQVLVYDFGVDRRFLGLLERSVAVRIIPDYGKLTAKKERHRHIVVVNEDIYKIVLR
jgi:hypothetical protein